MDEKHRTLILDHRCNLPCTNSCKYYSCSTANDFILKLIEVYGYDYMKYILELYKAAGHEAPIVKFMRTHSEVKWNEFVKTHMDAPSDNFFIPKDFTLM